MKRVLYSLLTLCLLFAGGSVKAAIGDVLHTLDEISNSKVYTIAAPRGGLVLNGAEDNACSSTNASISEAEGADQWAILKIDGQGYYLYNVAKSQFFHPGVGFSAKPKGNSRVDLMLANTPYDEDHVFKFKFGTLTLNNNNSGGFSFDTWSTEDAGNRLIITEAGDFDASEINTWRFTNITFNVKDAEDNTLVTETIGAVTGDNVVSSFANAFAGVTLDTPSTIATDQDQEINTGYTFDESKVPFKYSESFDAATWYTMSVNRPAGKKTATFDGTNFPNVLNAEITTSALFAFVGNPFGYNIYNYAAGANKAVGPTTSEDDPTKLEIVNAADAAKFIFEYSTEAGYESYQLFRYADNATAYINDNANYLGVWNSVNNRHDSGSNYIYKEIEPVTYEELAAIIEKYDGLVAGNKVGNYIEDGIAAVQAAVDAAKELTAEDDKMAISAAYANIAIAAEGLTEIELTEGYYQILLDNALIAKNEKSTKAVYVNAASEQLYWGEFDESNIKFVFKLTKNGDAWNIQSQENGYFAGEGWYPNAVSATVTSVYPATIVSDGDASFRIYTNNQQWCPQGNAQGTADGPQPVWGWNVAGPHGEASFAFVPVSEETVNELKIAAMPNVVSSLSEKKGSNDPGTITIASASAYNNIVNKVRDAAIMGDDAAKLAAYEQLLTLPSLIEINDIVEGYYYIASAGNGSGHSGGPYNYENKNALYNDGGILKWKAYSTTDAAELYKFTKAADGWYAYNVADGTYIGKGAGAYSTTVGTTATAENAQVFTAIGTGTGKFAMTWSGNAYVYGLSNSHNGSADAAGNVGVWGNANEAATYGVNTWFLHLATAEQIEAAKAAVFDKVIASATELTGGNEPNQYNTATVEAYNKALAAARDKAREATDAEKVELLDAFISAKEAVKLNPIVEGYYYIASAGNGPGYYTGDTAPDTNYNYEDKNALYNEGGLLKWKAFDRTDKSQVYKFTANADGNWDVYSIVDDTYIGETTGPGSGVSTVNTPGASQKFTPVVDGSGKFAIISTNYAYALNGSHNGSDAEAGEVKNWGTAAEAEKFGVNVWYIHPISEAEFEDLFVERTLWQIAEEASAPEAGKSYFVKNAYNGKFLDSENGASATYNALKNSAIWSIKATGDQLDNNDTYYLYSNGKDGYWKYANYSDGMDGFDWYGYIGMNAAFGKTDNAQAFTVLAATEADVNDSRTNVGANKEVKGYVIAATDLFEEQIFKLGVQGNDVALEPWNEDVAWEFYEATPTDDLMEVLAAAIEAYGDGPTESSENPGFYGAAVVEPYVAALEQAKAITSAEDEVAVRKAIRELEEAYEALVKNPLEDGYYYIVNAAAAFKENQGVEKALYVETTGDFLKWQTLDRTSENQIFAIKKLESGNYTIQNHGTGAYVTAPIDCSKASQGVYTAEAPADSAEQVIIYNDTYGEGQFELKSTAYTISYHPESNSGGKGSSGKIVGWYTAWSDFSAWYLYKVEDADWETIEQAKITDALKEAIAEATATLNEYVTYTKGTDGLINSDASNLSSNASSLNLAALVNGNLEENWETWPAYTAEGIAYLQVDLTDKEVADIYISLAPRTGGYAQGDTPKGWTISASNDGENWDYITYIATEADSIAVGKLYTYPAVNIGNEYTYVRFTSPGSISGRTGHTDHFALSEFQLYNATRDAIENKGFAEAVAEFEAAIATAREKANTSATQEDIDALKAAIEAFLNYEEEEAIKDYWQIAEEPAAEFETGKNYVLKNAYKNVYLSTNGGIVSTVDVLSDAEVWSIEPSANDAVASYILKSVAADGYWQYVNYGDQTWDETTPYDGYDWYDYAGLNAELGSAATAQEFTILPAQAGVEGSDAKDAVAAGAKVVENSFVLAAVEQIMGNWFKLGMQGTDAALEPWNEDVAWLFYEVTPVEDAAGALEIALAAYGQKEMKGGEYPGYYAADAVAEYNQTVANAKEALEGDDAEAQRAATAALIETGDKEYEINPIVDGETYFIVSAGNGPGYANGPYNYENRFAFYNEGGVVKLGDYDDTDVKYAYTFTQDADGNWNVKNIANNTYISKSDANYGQNVNTSEGLLYAQQLNLASEGKFSMTWVEERDLVCVYAINGSHNGTETPDNIKVWGTIPEAKQYGVNVWYLIPVSEDMKEKLTAIDGIAGAGEGLGVNAANGGITVSSATAQTVSVVSVSGAVVATQHVNAGETVSIQLVPGVYIVNGQKVLVK